SQTESWNWYLEYRDSQDATVSFGRGLTRYSEFFYTPAEEESARYAFYKSVPAHFQPENGSFVNIFDGSYYISNYIYRTMNTEVGFTGNFTKSGFHNMRYNTPGVHVIYSSGFANISRVDS
ncbi:MAG: hypothetical protein ABEI86_00665, partial [Halobacteriaceae archaeon]